MTSDNNNQSTHMTDWLCDMCVLLTDMKEKRVRARLMEKESLCLKEDTCTRYKYI